MGTTTLTLTRTTTRTTSSTTTTGTITSTTTYFNCDAKWEKGWSFAKKLWCCEHFEKGCEYDCDGDSFNWEEGWSEAKKQWCCSITHEKGCMTPAPTHVPTETPTTAPTAAPTEDLLLIKQILQKLEHLQKLHTTLPPTP